MKQEKIFEASRKAREIPLEFTDTLLKNTQKAVNKSSEFTDSVIKQSEKLRKPSRKADKIGTTIGGFIGIALLLIGIVWTFIGKPLWAVGTLFAGIITIASNIIHYRSKIK